MLFSNFKKGHRAEEGPESRDAGLGKPLRLPGRVRGGLPFSRRTRGGGSVADCLGNNGPLSCRVGSDAPNNRPGPAPLLLPTA